MVDKPTYEELQQRVEKLEEEVVERKRIEEALRKSEAQLRTTIESIPFDFFGIDETGRYFMQNSICRENWGDVTGMLPGEIGVDKKTYSLWKSNNQRAFAGEVVKGEVSFKRDGKDIFYYNIISPIYEDDEISGILGINFDMTELKQAEGALRESQERYRQLADSLPQVVFETDQEGNITFANRIAFDIFGYTGENFKEGLNALQMMIPEDRERALEKIKRVLEGEKSAGTEYTALRKDGSTYPVMIYSSPIIREERPVGLRGILVDLSEVKRAHEALRKSEEKIARSRKMEALGLLAGGVAHDLNNVLSGIVSYPEMILMDLPDDSKYRKPVKTMKAAGLRAAAIVQDLLTIVRGVATSKEPLNINGIVGEYLDSPEFEKLKQFHPSVTLETNLEPSLFNTIGSHVHIRKTVMNLVSNASEAIEGTGNVTISTMNRYVDKALRRYDNINKGEYVILSVSDGGSGISSEDFERIFEPFYTKKVMGRSGTGLGLAVVWNVIQDHNGYIDVVSDEKGTNFDLYFPVTTDRLPDKNSSVPVKDLKGHGEIILIVDDVESQREISCNMLETLGYKTVAVPSGEGAVEYLKENTVDLVLLDMIMDPGINGRETYKEIIKIHPAQKAVIVSGFAETDEVKKTQKMGAGQYLKKPLTLEALGQAIKGELKK